MKGAPAYRAHKGKRMGILDYIILAVVAAALALAVAYMLRCRRRGKCVGCSACDGRCGDCPYRTGGTDAKIKNGKTPSEDGKHGKSQV